MAPGKRKAHVQVPRQLSINNFRVPIRKNKWEIKPKESVESAQTEAIKINSLDNEHKPKKLKRSKAVLVQLPEEKVETSVVDLNKINARSKPRQSQKDSVKRPAPETNIGSLMATVFKRRKVAVNRDRARLKNLMDALNADPPPPWNRTYSMWADVETLEKRIKDFEEEEAEMKKQ